MSFLALNFVLATIWVLLRADFTLLGFVAGLLLGFLAIAVARPALGSHAYVRAAGGIVKLTTLFFGKLVVANVLLARDVLRRTPPFEPGFIRFDVRDLGPTQTVLLANLVSLTPGTITVDIDDEGRALYIHALYARDPEATRAECRALAELIHAAAGDSHEGRH